MSIITFTTDYKRSDYYLGALKGRIAGILPDIQLIDLAVGLEPFNILKAAFNVSQAFVYFPKGSIHLICMDSLCNPDKGHIILYYEGHIFITPDNGIAGLLFEKPLEKVIRASKKEVENTLFPELEIYPNIIEKLLSHSPESEIGLQTNDFRKSQPYLATYEKNIIVGKVIYIDSFGNAISNITKDLFEMVGKNMRFEIFVQSRKNLLTCISKNYSEVSEGEFLAVFNSSDLLEVAVNKGNIATLLGLTTDSSIRIKFDDHYHYEANRTTL